MPAIRREPAAILTLLLAASLAGCGMFSRSRDAGDDLRAALSQEDPAARDDALRRLRGAEPMIPSVWLASAGAAGSPEAALAMVDRGREYLPDEPNLLLARISLLAQLGRRDEQVAAARAALSRDEPQPVRAEALWYLIDGLLALDDAAGAEAAVLRLGGLSSVLPGMTAAAWGRIALVHEAAGRTADADAALRASLDLGVAGLDALRRDSLVPPGRQDAAHALVSRAAEAEPAHPDLQLYLLVDRMAGGDLAGAEASLASLPEPLPERLVAERTALHARVLLLQDRVEEGIAILRARLNEAPSDPYALGVLLEAWHARGIPDRDEVAWRLRASRRGLFDPALRAEVEATLTQLADEPAPPP